MKNKLYNLWQQQWDGCEDKLKAFKQTIKKWCLPHLQVRREQVVITHIDNREPEVTSNLGSKNSVEPLFVSKANDNRPYLSVCIDNENITALLDSGSNANILGSSGLYLLRKLNLNIDYNTALQLTTADGQIQNTLGFVYLPITFNGEDCKIKVLVVPSISHQLILGIDFILQFKLNINFGNFSYQSCAGTKLTNTVSQCSSSDYLVLKTVLLLQ
nr:unnamed protein product [Callosobruchus chinensis]